MKITAEFDTLEEFQKFVFGKVDVDNPFNPINPNKKEQEKIQTNLDIKLETKKPEVDIKLEAKKQKVETKVTESAKESKAKDVTPDAGEEFKGLADVLRFMRSSDEFGVEFIKEHPSIALFIQKNIEDIKKLKALGETEAAKKLKEIIENE